MEQFYGASQRRKDVAVKLVSASNHLVNAIPLDQLNTQARSWFPGFMRVACQELQTVLGAFRELTKIGDERRSHSMFPAANDKELHRNMIENYEQFMLQFARIERAILIDAGMDRRMINYLFQDSAAILRRLNRNEDLEINLRRIRDRISDLKSEICSYADIKEGDTEFFPRVRLRRKFMRGALKVIGGSAIIGVNATIDTSGAAGAFSTLSVKLGFLILDKGADVSAVAS